MTSLRRKVSVIIPHFNEGEKISRQIKALKKQSHQAKEIIIIDDGSNKEKYLETIQQYYTDYNSLMSDIVYYLGLIDLNTNIAT